MNNADFDIENVLQGAPRPAPPAGLKQNLLFQAAVPMRKAFSGGSPDNSPAGWLRRWWPTLASAAVSLACAVVIPVQRMEINDLKASIQALSPVGSVQPSLPSASQLAQDAFVKAPAQSDELASLRQQAAQLKSEVARLEQIRSENEKLRAQLTARPDGFTLEELEGLNQARDRAFSIQCVNNLKQIGLAVRVWALDNEDLFPTNFLCMSNELNTPKILVCPADTNRFVAANFSTYADANCSYEMFNGSDKEPAQVLTRCPIHGNIGLCDGSVQMGAAKRHPDWLVQRDGKLYFEPPPNPPSPSTP